MSAVERHGVVDHTALPIRVEIPLRLDEGVVLGRETNRSGRGLLRAPRHLWRIQGIQGASSGARRLFHDLEAAQVRLKAHEGREEGTETLDDELVQSVEVGI